MSPAQRDREITRLHSEGLIDQRIAEILGSSRDVIRRARNRLRLKAHGQKSQMADEELHPKVGERRAKMHAMRRQGMTVRQIALALGIAKPTVEVGLSYPDPAEKAAWKQRACICCGTAFISQGAHNRMCNPCRGRSDDGMLIPPAGAVSQEIRAVSVVSNDAMRTSGALRAIGSRR